MSLENKFRVVEMPDGTRWAVPVEIIAKSRAEEYKDEFGGDLERSLNEDTLIVFNNDYEIEDWASNDMDWEDVSQYARKLKGYPEPLEHGDFQEGWMNSSDNYDAEILELTEKDFE